MSEERKKVWINEFQTKLFFRILAYLLIYLVCLGNLLFIWRLLTEGPGNPVDQYLGVFVDNGPALVCLTLLLPILTWDAIRFSHRLVGPVVRFRRAMQDLVAGQAIRPIKLRKDDFLTELRDDFNALLEVLERQGVHVLKPTDGSVDPAQKRPA